MNMKGLCISVSYSVKNSNSNKQQYRTNLLHTTGRIEVKGNGKDLFLEHLKEIIKLMEIKGNCSQLNRLLEHQLSEYMRKFPTGNVENKRGKKYVGRETDLNQMHNREIMSVVKAQNEYHHDNTSGDASLADQNSRREKDTSGDASLVSSIQRESNAASGDASLVPLQKQKEANVSGDASLIKEQNKQHKLCTSGEASLVMSKHQHINKITSGEASLVPGKHNQNEIIASGEASLACDIPQEMTGTVCKSIEHRFSETEVHIIDDQLNNSETFETIITCAICSGQLIVYKAQLSSAADVSVFCIKNVWVKKQSVPKK